MKSLASVFLLLNLLIACYRASTEQSNRMKDQITFPSDTSKFPIGLLNTIETNLQKEGEDTIVTGNIIGKLNGIDFTLSIRQDTVAFFQKINAIWELTDTLSIGNATSIQKKDLNGDKIQDLYLVTNINAGGNLETLVLIFSTVEKRFVHHPEFDLPNIELDSISGLVRASWFGHGGIKWIYKPEGEHLIFQEGIGLFEQDNSWILEFYTQISGPNTAHKTIKGPLNNLNVIFEKTLWDTSNN